MQIRMAWERSLAGTLSASLPHQRGHQHHGPEAEHDLRPRQERGHRQVHGQDEPGRERPDHESSVGSYRKAQTRDRVAHETPEQEQETTESEYPAAREQEDVAVVR